MYNYCTLFDRNYLTRGLAMYESLKKHSANFHLYIFAFDDQSYSLLKKLNLESITVISLNEFEDEELLKVKSDRTAAEYCWTSTSSIIKYAIETYKLNCCTYLDADLYFFSDPSVLIEEMGEKSVLITDHRYTKKYDQSAKSGIYCVQFMTFKNSQDGMKVLNWWRNACIDWCYARHEDGKFGDQKYLDDWTERFKGIVHVLENRGGGVAPWNIQQYDLSDKNFKLVFYHFHYFILLENNQVELGIYKLKEQDIQILYVPYIKHLKKITERLLNPGENDFNGIARKKPFSWRTPLKFIKRKIEGAYNVYDIKELLTEFDGKNIL
ncbi:MAG: glycosyl transferase [Bacteroidetes bacterium]|nr:glycosyl transferase [Bacteroidota bacterium]